MGDICDLAAGMFSVRSMGLMMIAPELEKEEYRSLFGCQFTSVSSKVKFDDPGGNCVAEVALLLENYEVKVAVAVEVDRILHVPDVEWYIDCLKRLRTLEHFAGTAIYAAVAGIHIHDGVHDLALRSGMCVLEIDGDTEEVNVVKPEKLAVW